MCNWKNTISLVYYCIFNIYFFILFWVILHCFPTLNASISPLCTNRRAVFFPICSSSCSSFSVSISFVLLSIITRSFSVYLIPCSPEKPLLTEIYYTGVRRWSDEGISAQTLAAIAEASILVISGIIGLATERRKDEKRNQFQQKIDDAEREMKRLDSTDFRLKK